MSRRSPSRLRLFACMMYEAVLLFGVVFFADYIFDTLTQSRSGLTLLGTRQAVLFVAIGLYFVLCWRKHGQTLPMKTWNIRLVSRQAPVLPWANSCCAMRCAGPSRCWAPIWCTLPPTRWAGRPSPCLLYLRPFSTLSIAGLTGTA
ncbi:hypothetical protein TKWG_15845 [Advenella kashmirensis WT001]|uniref:RDD domain-containing protein n=1 Tax=Advenella kashmirensis (strain DSM 17095 / LMG 22695 / WT001) TaxID=1036672 RepID=I3UDQ6_ADVKW|nr:hypothetical protein TKWG_15845 [Advenella kashmirensis WT001]